MRVEEYHLSWAFGLVRPGVRARHPRDLRVGWCWRRHGILKTIGNATVSQGLTGERRQWNAWAIQLQNLGLWSERVLWTQTGTGLVEEVVLAPDAGALMRSWQIETPPKY